MQERDRQVNSCNCLFDSFGRAKPNNSRAARYSLLVAISGLTGKTEFLFPIAKKDLIYGVLLGFFNSFKSIRAEAWESPG